MAYIAVFSASRGWRLRLSRVALEAGSDLVIASQWDRQVWHDAQLAVVDGAVAATLKDVGLPRRAGVYLVGDWSHPVDDDVVWLAYLIGAERVLGREVLDTWLLSRFTEASAPTPAEDTSCG